VIEAARLLQGDAVKTICVTLGKRGAVSLVGGEVTFVPGRPVQAVDSTGAGDCFVGAVAARLANGRPVLDAIEYANAAASICVQRMGAGPSMPTAAEVESVVFLGSTAAKLCTVVITRGSG
jgi:ribokinase